ncbi:hypothetical protein JCGZ_08845 [Jatropha curcas]|uniref:Uncharacterized protein n=1 Tax=Jatropha curcas TaxID=180498 RepID=A0A067KKC0_JATCU|nr:hypothetical protein JCGZ_08845 [Jatropha curcas]
MVESGKTPEEVMAEFEEEEVERGREKLLEQIYIMVLNVWDSDEEWLDQSLEIFVDVIEILVVEPKRLNSEEEEKKELEDEGVEDPQAAEEEGKKKDKEEKGQAAQENKEEKNKGKASTKEEEDPVDQVLKAI